MANENIEVGTRAVAKVGRNEISVEVIAVELRILKRKSPADPEELARQVIDHELISQK